jgi:hypothetical protein
MKKKEKITKDALATSEHEGSTRSLFFRNADANKCLDGGGGWMYVKGGTPHKLAIWQYAIWMSLSSSII